MNSHSSAEAFDFTASFRKTLEQFELLGASSKLDFKRSMEKRSQRLVEQSEAEQALSAVETNK